MHCTRRGLVSVQRGHQPELRIQQGMQPKLPNPVSFDGIARCFDESENHLPDLVKLIELVGARGHFYPSLAVYIELHVHLFKAQRREPVPQMLNDPERTFQRKLPRENPFVQLVIGLGINMGGGAKAYR